MRLTFQRVEKIRGAATFVAGTTRTMRRFAVPIGVLHATAGAVSGFPRVENEV